MIRRGVVLALILGGLAAKQSVAQTPPTQTATPPVVDKPKPAADVPPPPPTPAALPDRPANDAKPAAAPAKHVAAIDRVGRDPITAPGRFANPGGVGRYAEYYTPFTPMYSEPRPPSHVAVFGQGGGPNRAEQIDAFRVGQYRAQNIQNNINAYGRPVGFGFGYGYGFGRGYGGLR